MRKISIIILTWNALDYTKKCLSSLMGSIPENIAVYVVDNGSTDGTIEYLEQQDHIFLIKNNENTGFVRGNNMAIDQIKDGDLILLNNDIVITQDNWVELLEKTAYEAADIGVVGCRLVNEKNELLHAGTVIWEDDCWGQQIGGTHKDIGQYSSTRDVQGVVFACAYIKREVVDKIGGLNTAFFSYFEDTDYCLRAIKAGYRVVCCGDVTLLHYQNVSTKVNNVDFWDMFTTSQKTFRDLWGDYLKAQYTRTMAWHSVMNLPSGYAGSAQNFMETLDRRGVDIRYKYVYGSGTPVPIEEPEVCDRHLMKLIREREFLVDCPQVVYGQGDVFARNNGKYKIGFTMLETTGIPEEWVRQCNLMDEVWVPSAFNVETFRNSGVKVPIHVIPLGVNTDLYNPGITLFKQFNKYAFLSVFEWGERKAPEILLQAYSKAFTNKEDVVLICKVTNNDGSVNINKEIEKLNLPENGPDIIFLYNTKFSDFDMPSLYRSADCFVLPTRGEGWGMAILEAMACGLPVIATNWSSQTDFFNETNGYPIKVEKLVDAGAKCPYYEGFQWAQPDEEHLIHLLRYVYSHQQEARAAGLKAAKEVAQNWTWDHAADKIIARLDEIGELLM